MLANNNTTAKAIQNLNSLSVVIYLIVNNFQTNKKASLPFGRPASSPTTFLFPSCSGCKSVVDSDLA